MAGRRPELQAARRCQPAGQAILVHIDSRCLIDNPQRKADLSSRQDLKKNPDGSVDLYFGLHAPKDFESNWVQTLPGKHWFSYFRLYAPTEAYLDKSWKFDDITPAP